MALIFISYAGEDGQEVASLAKELERVGYTSWFYERDALAGGSYVSQVLSAIDACQIFLLLISSNALESEAVGRELVHAFETKKQTHLIPLLKDLNYPEFQRRKPDWKFQLGASVAVVLDSSDVETTANKLVQSFNAMQVLPERIEKIDAAKNDAVLVRLQILPQELVQKIRALIPKREECVCTYSFTQPNGKVSDERPTSMLHIAGGLFVTLTDVPRHALLKLTIKCQEQTWESNYEDVHVTPIFLSDEG